MKMHKGLAVVAALGCGALAPLAATAAASAANPTAANPTAGTVGAPHNGPLAFSGTSVAANDTTPSGTGWSEANPDGTDGGGRHEIVPSGGGVDPTSSDSDVVFSHDGSRVAFIQRSDSTLWTANADGSDARRLAVPAVGYGLEKPCWSGDGATVYFTQIVNSANGSYVPSLLQVPATGGAATPVLTQPDANGDYDVVVSPDGSKIAYTTDAPGFAGPKVVVADAKTRAKLSEIPKSTAPQFSPDGKVLAVAGMPDSTIVFYPPDGLAGPGSRGQTVVSDLGTFRSFAFSPDSSEIAYASTNGQIQISQLWNGVAVKTGIAESHVGEAISWQNGPSYTGPVSALVQNDKASVRYGGADRIATSVVTADAAYGDPASGLHANVAVISRSDTFADALAGNALAAQKGGPLMLTGSAKLDQRVAAELTATLAPHSTVYLLGGTQALSPRVEADIAALGFTPKRLAGTDRFSTAVRIAEEISAHPKAILIATGTNFPDALAAGAATTGNAGNAGNAADWSGVVVLTDGATMPAATKAYLSGFSPATARIFGVGGAGLTAARTLPYANQIVPLSGKDRYETAADVATSQDLFADSRGTGSVRRVQFAGLATGRNWPDALSGGALVGALHGALLLADGPSVPKEELVLPSTLLTLGVFGGTSVVPNSAVAEVVNDTWGGSAASVVRSVAR